MPRPVHDRLKPRVAQQLRDQRLHHVADPPRAERLSPFDAGDRDVVSRHQRDAHVRMQDLRHRADHGPACPGVVDERGERRARDAARMIVLDQQHVRMSVEDLGEVCRSGRIEGGS